MSRHILLVEDEPHLQAALKLNLSLDGHEITCASTVREAWAAIESTHVFDLVLLDVMLPDGNGFDLCRRLRDAGSRVPVLMLTALADPAQRVRGLQAGADDYLPKPFDLSELLARVQALFRRAEWATAPVKRPATVSFGNVVANLDTHTVTVGEHTVKLTQLELDLLGYFAENAGRVVSREELLAKVWKLSGNPSTRTVDNFIARLRKQLEIDARKPVHFLSIRGAGYKFVP